MFFSSASEELRSPYRHGESYHRWLILQPCPQAQMGAIASQTHRTMNLEAKIIIHAIAGAIGGLGLHCLVQWTLGAQLTVYGAMAAGFALMVAIALIIRGEREEIAAIGAIAVAFTLGMAIAPN